MADYYDNSAAGQRFQPGTTVRADEVDAKFDEVATGFGGVEGDITRALKLPTGTTTDQVITQSALNRRNLTIGFDADGNLTLRAGLKWEGDWAASTSYIAGDFVRAPNNNLYVCDVSHTSGATFVTTNWLLAVDIGDLAAIQTATENARDAALQAETDAQTAETGAVTAKNAAETALDSFTDIYLGVKTADPTLDNDGNALQSGALYYNSSSGALRLYTGSAWIEAAFDPSGALVASNNLSDLASAATSRTNLGLGTAATQPDTRYNHRANNLSDVASAATARSNLSAQEALVSGTNIKTVNSQSLLGSGNLSIDSVASLYTEYTASGTFTKDAGATWVYVECIGGGGSGRLKTNDSDAWGGGGGAFSSRLVRASEITTSIAVTVGGGGEGGAGSGGGDSSFGTLVTAPGGDSPNGGGGELGGGLNGDYATGGYSSGGGGNASRSGGKTVMGGAGGGGASAIASGQGGVSAQGGNGGNGATQSSDVDVVTAVSGSIPGGGGGGAYVASTNTATGHASGDGARGVVRVWQW